MTVADSSHSAELALLRGELMTALTRIEGDVRLVLQQIEHASRRAADLERRHESLDSRVDALEATRATRSEVEKVKDQARDELRADVAAVRNDLVEKGRRNLTLAGIGITVALGGLNWALSATGKG